MQKLKYTKGVAIFEAFSAKCDHQLMHQNSRFIPRIRCKDKNNSRNNQMFRDFF